MFYGYSSDINQNKHNNYGIIGIVTELKFSEF